MSYIEKNLMSGESIIYRSKLHWVIFFWPAFWFVVAVIFSIASVVNTSDIRMVAFFGIPPVLIALVMGISAFITYKSSEFGITNKRVIVKVGFFRINSLEVLLNKIEGIQVNQGIAGRILGYGSITVSGTGGTRDPFDRIDSPLEFRRKAQEQISVAQDSR